MLICLSSNQTFAIKLIVVPRECSTDFNYGVIIGQDTIWALNLDTSMWDNMILWGDKQIPMVPCDYWTGEWILQQKACFVKHPKSEPAEIPSDEVFLSKTLTPINCVQEDLEQVTQNCMDNIPVYFKFYAAMKHYSWANAAIGKVNPLPSRSSMAQLQSGQNHILGCKLLFLVTVTIYSNQ